MQNALLEFARHGNLIPKVKLGDCSNFRIANHHLLNSYSDCVMHAREVSSVTVADFIALANLSPAILVIATHNSAYVALQTFSSIIPKNLISAQQLTGIEPNNAFDYQALIKHMLEIHGEGFIKAGGFNKWQSARYQKQVERAVRSKSSLDEWFYHIPYGATTLHQVAAECREGRTILGLDFNGMYPSCFADNHYPDPARLRYGVGKRFISDCLAGSIAGAFKCHISAPDAFMRTYFMQTISFGDTLLKVKLPDTFVAILHVNEIQFWSAHASIETMEGVYSEVCQPHPLSKLANKIYQRKLDADPIEKALVKQELVLMHASTARSGHQKIPLQEALDRYGFSEEFLSLCEEPHLRLPLINDQANVLCLQRQVLASARVKLLTEIKRIAKAFPDALLCYANVDSLHFSLPNDLLEAFKENLDIGSQLGQLKIEFEGDTGLWLDPGRWWIKKDCRQIAYRSGSHYDNANVGRMSLHHHYINAKDALVTVDPMEIPQSYASMRNEVADLVSINVEIAKKLWKNYFHNVK